MFDVSLLNTKPVPAFTDSPLVPQAAVIKAIHIQQLRDAVLAPEAS
jgi:hypothetical protein